MANHINDFDPAGFPGAPGRHPPFPTCPPGPRGPAGPQGPPGPRGLPGSLNNTAESFVYAQLAHLLEQLIEYYPGLTLYVFLPGISPWWISGIPYRVYQSTEGTFAGLFMLNGSGEVAFPLSAIAALQFETDTAVYNPAITYLPKPIFPPGYDTNIVTAIYEYVATLTGTVLFNIGSNVRSMDLIYKNKYGLIVQATDELGNNPAFIPVTHITGIAPQETAGGAKKIEAFGSGRAESAPPTRIQAAIYL